MTENLKEPRSDELEEQAIKLKTQKSEIGKYVAGAFDRLSTAAIVVGFMGPVAGIIANPSSIHQFDWERTIWLILASPVWIVISIVLHMFGRNTLRKGLG